LKKYKKAVIDKTRINERVIYNTPTVRVIDQNNNQMGIIPTREAVKQAKDLGYDLVEVSPSAKPPVCKIQDYGKFKYEKAKKDKAEKAKQVVAKLKELKLHPRTDDNDYSYRLKMGKEFLAKGCKLKVTVVFKGREMAHKEYGGRWIKQIEEDLKEFAKVDSPSKQEGRNMSIIFSPLKN